MKTIIAILLLPVELLRLMGRIEAAIQAGSRAAR